MEIKNVKSTKMDINVEDYLDELETLEKYSEELEMI